MVLSMEAIKQIGIAKSSLSYQLGTSMEGNRGNPTKDKTPSNLRSLVGLALGRYYYYLFSN